MCCGASGGQLPPAMALRAHLVKAGRLLHAVPMQGTGVGTPAHATGHAAAAGAVFARMFGKKADGAPKVKRAPSAYNNFVKQKFEEVKRERLGRGESGDFKDISPVVASMWKSLTQSEKDAYKSV